MLCELSVFITPLKYNLSFLFRKNGYGYPFSTIGSQTLYMLATLRTLTLTHMQLPDQNNAINNNAPQRSGCNPALNAKTPLSPYNSRRGEARNNNRTWLFGAVGRATSTNRYNRPTSLPYSREINK